MSVRIPYHNADSPEQGGGIVARTGIENDTVMTKTGYDRLTAELIELRSNGRSEISRQLEEARSFGDVSENAEYAAAKDEQAKLESRILWLESQLSKAKILDTTNIDASRVTVGTTVTIEDATNREIFVYTLVGSEEADPRNKKISVQSPVGQALINRTVGDEVQVKVPRGVRYLRVRDITVM
jgi:transcription elongation factor GreA